jgi:hypothetical protein
MKNVKSDNFWSDSALRGFLGEIKRRHGVVDTLALPNMRDLPPVRIESLFVQPLIANELVSPSSSPSTWPSGETLFDAFNNNSRLILLGDPGSGKTTLANWLSWRLASGLTAPLPESLSGKIPLPCVLREMPQSIFRMNATILDLAVCIAAHLLDEKTAEQIKEKLSKYVSNGQYVLILDGVDEIPSAHREIVAQWIQEATTKDAVVLATSRVVGYEDFPVHRPNFGLQEKTKQDESANLFSQHILELDSLIALPVKDEQGVGFGMMKDFLKEGWRRKEWASIKYLMPFDQKRIGAFVENWYLQRSGSESEARKRAEDLMFALGESDVTSELARTPNLLSLMAIVHRERAHLPDGKALLYKEIANAYINTIDEYRKIGSDDASVNFGWETRESWIAYVGFQMQLIRSENISAFERSGVLATEDQVLNWLTIAMAKSGVSQTQLSAREFLKWVARRSGLLLPKGEGRFAFVHLSFQEYFCARFMASKIVSPSFIKNSENESEITRKKIFEWSRNIVWHESLVYLFELISGERDSEWGEDLAEVTFGSIGDETDFIFAKASLATRILADRHVTISSERKRTFAQRSTKAAISEWNTKWSSEKPKILPVLAANKFAVICIDGDEAFVWNKFPAMNDLPIDIEKNLDIVFLVSSKPIDSNYLRKLTKLRLLEFHGVRLDSVDFVEKFECLQQLNISQTGIDDISILKSLKSIENLDLSENPIANLTPIRKLSTLRSLSLKDTLVGSVVALKELKNLETLYLSRTKVRNLAPVSNLKSLRTISISGTGIRDISALRELPNLVVLIAESVNLKDYTPLLDMTSLQFLALDNVASIDKVVLSRLSNLEFLTLSHNDLDDISFLSNLQSLIELDISNTGVIDISCLAKLTNLIRLNISNTNVTDVSALSGLVSLRQLNIKNCPIADISMLEPDEKNLSIIS